MSKPTRTMSVPVLGADDYIIKILWALMSVLYILMMEVLYGESNDKSTNESEDQRKILRTSVTD